MATIQDQAEIACPLDVVFEYVADYRNALDWMAGFERFEPVGPIARGLGASVRASGRVMGMPVTTTLRITDFVENERITSVSDTPVKSTSTWHFQEVNSGTLVRFVGEYEFPGMNVPFIRDRVIQELKAVMRESLQNLRTRCEGRA